MAELMDKQLDNIVANLVKDCDKAILSSAENYAGCVITEDTIKRRGSISTMPDGTEIFSFDGVALVKFWPIEVTSEFDGNEYHIKANRKYQIFNHKRKK